MLLIRHVFVPSNPDQLQGPEDLTEARVLECTRVQSVLTRRIPADPPDYWVIFIGDGKLRSRLWFTFRNYGELRAEQTNTWRVFDLRPCGFPAPLAGRLFVEWNKNAQVWSRMTTAAAGLPVLEIADRDKVPFPGFDGVLLRYDQLRDRIGPSRKTPCTSRAHSSTHAGGSLRNKKALARCTAWRRSPHGWRKGRWASRTPRRNRSGGSLWTGPYGRR
ncbi:hypothetical protein GCM10027405_03010 [Arthrobacter alkaliphilus]